MKKLLIIFMSLFVFLVCNFRVMAKSVDEESLNRMCASYNGFTSKKLDSSMRACDLYKGNDQRKKEILMGTSCLYKTENEEKIDYIRFIVADRYQVIYHYKGDAVNEIATTIGDFANEPTNFLKNFYITLAPSMADINSDDKSVALSMDNFILGDSFCPESIYISKKRDVIDSLWGTEYDLVYSIESSGSSDSVKYYREKAEVNVDNETRVDVDTGDLLDSNGNVIPDASRFLEEQFGNASNVMLPGNVEGMDFCSENGVKLTLHVLGYIVFTAKLLVPLLLIIFGSIDFGKALMDSDDKAIKDSLAKLIKRTLAGIIIFFLPTIFNFAFSLIDEAVNNQRKFEQCSKCLFSPFSGECSYTKIGE